MPASEVSWEVDDRAQMFELTHKHNETTVGEGQAGGVFEGRRGRLKRPLRLRLYHRVRRGQPRHLVRRRRLRHSPCASRPLLPCAARTTHRRLRRGSKPRLRRGKFHRRQIQIRGEGAHPCITIPHNLPCAAEINLPFGDLRRCIGILQNLLQGPYSARGASSFSPYSQALRAMSARHGARRRHRHPKSKSSLVYISHMQRGITRIDFGSVSV
jgi:hypothetical protein